MFLAHTVDMSDMYNTIHEVLSKRKKLKNLQSTQYNDWTCTVRIDSTSTYHVIGIWSQAVLYNCDKLKQAEI